jgi:hypothetical protein
MSKLDKELCNIRAVSVASPSGRQPIFMALIEPVATLPSPPNPFPKNPESAVWREINAKKLTAAIDAMLRCLTVDWPFFLA